MNKEVLDAIIGLVYVVGGTGIITILFSVLICVFNIFDWGDDVYDWRR